MESIRNRATEQFPTVLITLLSIVQALALEFLWDHLHHRSDLFEFSLASTIGWLQIAASLNGIILIWLSYASMVMRFRWIPSTLDSVLPFFVGLIEFLLIDMMGPGRVGQWLLVLTVVFATMIVGSHHVFRRARLDLANKEFFDRYEPAGPRDFLAHTIIIASLALWGAWQWYSGTEGWIALSIMIATMVILAIETRNAAQFWKMSMGES